MSDTRRVLDLPRVRYRATPESITWWSETLRAHPRAPRLLPAQVEGLEACADAAYAPPTANGRPGVLGMMGCGSGKTLFLQLAPHVFGAERPLLILPAHLVEQLDRDIELWSAHYPCARPRTLSYGKLSHPSARNVLEDIRPDLILLDEAHKLGGASTSTGRPTMGNGARAKRLWSYCEAHRDVPVVAVTGTLTNRSIREIGDMAALVLRDWSPLPFGAAIDAWASVMNPGGEPTPNDWLAVRPLQEWSAGRVLRDKHHARRALRDRIESAPGVVVTGGLLNVSAGLRLRMVHPAKTIELERLDDLWELPDGTQLVDSVEYYRHRRTLRLGFFYRWRPETVDPGWFAARGAWHKVVRDHVEYGGFETPHFVQEAAARGALSAGAVRAWRAWDAVRDVAAPEREVVWVDIERPRALARAFWKQHDDHGLVWYHSHAIADAFDADDTVRVVRAGEPPPRRRGRVVISLAHRTGWNHESGSTVFARSLVLEPPTSAQEMEQLLARQHRPGQRADAVLYELYGDDQDRHRWGARARYVADLTTPQRLLLADWVAPRTAER